MENFIVSARKYRPVTFDSVVGQESITNTLKNAIRNQHLAQAFLFAGPRGIGKTTCARILAKTINCFNPTENIEPCNECESCVSFNKSASFNIHELDAASNNSVDDIRSLVDQVRIPPQVGKYKVYIIDEVHMLSPSAFNAFLKTLEEPPAYAKFILATTEKHKIIPTILSRCQIFDFRRISVPDIAQHLKYVADKEKVEATDEALHIIAQKADGAMRDALSIFDQLVSFSGDKLTYEMVIEHLNVLDYTYYFNMVDQILDGDIPKTLLLINEIIDRGFDGQHFIIGLGEHLRNLLVCKDPETIKLLEVSDTIKSKYADQAEKCTSKFLLKALTIHNRCDVEYKSSNNKHLHIELALMQMCSIGSGTENVAEKKKPVIKEPGRKSSEKPQKPAEKVEKKPEEPVKKENNAKSPIPVIIDPSKRTREKKTQNPSQLGPRGRTISIKPENNIKPDDNGNGDMTATHSEANDFSEDQLQKVWVYFTESIARQYPNFYSTLKQRQPELKEGYVVSLTVSNTIQEIEIRNRKDELLNFLRRELSNYKIQLETVVDESQEESKPYSPDEKFKTMVKKNPALLKLKEEMDLDLDY